MPAGCPHREEQPQQSLSSLGRRGNGGHPLHWWWCSSSARWNHVWLQVSQCRVSFTFWKDLKPFWQVFILFMFNLLKKDSLWFLSQLWMFRIKLLTRNSFFCNGIIWKDISFLVFFFLNKCMKKNLKHEYLKVLFFLLEYINPFWENQPTVLQYQFLLSSVRLCIALLVSPPWFYCCRFAPESCIIFIMFFESCWIAVHVWMNN